tara:strand:- start:75 stop:392 length:318 start_codon:yes stop_codon:yes gene_type:complete
LLRGQQTEPFFTRDSLFGKFVVRAESSRVRAQSWFPIRRGFLQSASSFGGGIHTEGKKSSKERENYIEEFETKKKANTIFFGSNNKQRHTSSPTTKERKKQTNAR